MAVFCDHRCPQKTLVQRLGTAHFSKDNEAYFNKETQTPKCHSKDVSFPAFSGGAKKFERLNQEKGVEDHTCAGHFTRIMSLNPNSVTSVLHEENEACPRSDGSQQ